MKFVVIKKGKRKTNKRDQELKRICDAKNRQRDYQKYFFVIIHFANDVGMSQLLIKLMNTKNYRRHKFSFAAINAALFPFLLYFWLYKQQQLWQSMRMRSDFTRMKLRTIIHCDNKLAKMRCNTCRLDLVRRFVRADYFPQAVMKYFRL